MTKETLSPLSSVLNKNSKALLSSWIELQLADKNRAEGVSESSLKNSSNEFFELFRAAAKDGNIENQETAEWEAVYRMLADLSASRALQGSTPTETARFILSLKQPLFKAVSEHFGEGNAESIKATWELSSLIDQLGIYTNEVFQKSREAIIRRQQKDMLEASTPVIRLWDGILVVPLIGTLDSARTQIVMESLLQKIVETSAKVAIIDITGVPTVDTQTAQHLMKTVSATRLMGADCIISGIRPQIAQTIVHLGIDIYDITTKATMADAIGEALGRLNYAIIKTADSTQDR